MAYSSAKIANRFIERSSKSLTPLQIIKLVYIAHGWSWAKLGRPLINEDVHAWQYGPVVPQLYRAMKQYKAEPVTAPIPDGDARAVESDVDELIEAVYETYGRYSGGQLSSLTHRPNSPWFEVWHSQGENGVISNEIISSHYKALDKVSQTNL